MPKQFKKILSILLIASLMPDLSIALQPGVRSPRHVQASEDRKSRLLAEALSPATVSQHRFPLDPFVSYWSQFQSSSLFPEGTRKGNVFRWGAMGMASAITLGVLHHLGASWNHLLSVGLTVPIMAVVYGQNPPPPPFINLSIVSDPSSPNEIQIHVEGDQLGIFRRITSELRSNNINLDPGTALEPTEKGSLIRLIVTADVDKAKKVIAGIRISKLTPSIEPTRRLAISVLLRNEPGAIAHFLDRLYESVPALNIVRLSSSAEDGLGWVQLDEVTVPVNWKGYDGRRPDVYLRKHVRSMTPLVEDSEVTFAEVNEATLLAFDKVQSDDTPKPFVRRVMDEIFSMPVLLGWHGRVNEEEVKSFTDVFLLAKKVHENEKRIQPGEPDYITHPKKVYSWLRKWGVKHPDGLKLALLHDVPEKLNSDDSAELRAQLADVLQRSSRRLRFMLNVMTNYAKGRYNTYAKRLTMYAENILLAAKLADMIDNLEDIFEIDLVKNPKFVPSRQYAKRLRFGLPIVSWTPALKNDVYRASRRDFLRVLIHQSRRLSDSEFLRLYLADGEDKTQASAEMVISINSFLKWMSLNTDCLPEDVSSEQVQQFRTRLQLLRQYVFQGRASSEFNREIDPSTNEILNLRSSDASVRQTAFHSLRQAGWKPADPLDRLWNAFAAGQIYKEAELLGGQGNDALESMLGSSDTLARTTAADILGKAGNATETGPRLLRAFSEEAEDSVSESLLAALKEIVLNTPVEQTVSATESWDFKPLVAALQYRDAGIRHLAAEVLAISGWEPITDEDRVWYAIGLGEWRALALKSTEAIAPLCRVLYGSDNLDATTENALYKKLKTEWPPERTLPWLASKIGMREGPDIRLLPLLERVHPALPSAEKLDVIALHHEIAPSVRKRSYELGGKILVINLDSHDDYRLGHSLGSITPGNWGYFIEEWEGTGYYMWLRSWWNQQFKNVSGKNWADDPERLLTLLRDKLLEGDVKAIWLTIDADTYSLRHYEDWNLGQQRHDGVYRHITEADIEKDLVAVRDVLLQHEIPVERIVLAVSEKYLDKRPDEVPGFVEYLERLIQQILMRPASGESRSLQRSA